MRREHTSVSQEDYLKAIWENVQEDQEPIAARLAEDLGVTPPAVTAALKRMARGGFARVRRDGRIELSQKGSAIAESLVLRHRLAEMLLTKVIGVDWTKAHEEAEKLEHGISAEVAALLMKKFGKDSRCPHGVPLLGGMAKLKKKLGTARLSEAETGGLYEVMRVYEGPEVFGVCGGAGVEAGRAGEGAESRVRSDHDDCASSEQREENLFGKAGDGADLGAPGRTVKSDALGLVNLLRDLFSAVNFQFNSIDEGESRC